MHVTRRFIVLSHVLLGFGLLHGAAATTYLIHADGSGDFPNLQAAIAGASPGDTIEMSDGTYTGAGNRDIFLSKSLTIRAQAGPTGYCIIDCQGSSGDPHTGIELDDGAYDGRLEGITIQNAFTLGDGAALFCHEGRFYIDSCIFWNNHSGHDGGAIWAFASELFITNSFFAGNAVEQYGRGGVIYAEDGCYVEVTYCGFNGNWGDTGGVLYSSHSEIWFTNCTINNTDGPMSNFAVYLDDGTIADIDNTIISFGTDEAVYCTEGVPSLGMNCCDVYGNAGGDWTGCISGLDEGGGNISADPLYCGVPHPYYLHENSPCAPEANPECGLIGRWPVGCGPAVFEVRADGTGDYPTIQAAIDAAPEGMVIELVDGTYTGDGNRDLDFGGKSVTVRSQGGNPSTCVIDCEGAPSDQHRGFHFHSGETADAVVENIKITGGFLDYYSWQLDGGGIRCEAGSSPTIRGCVFPENDAVAGFGGGCSIDATSAPHLVDCRFLGNTALDGGGAHCLVRGPCSWAACSRAMSPTTAEG